MVRRRRGRKDRVRYGSFPVPEAWGFGPDLFHLHDFRHIGAALSLPGRSHPPPAWPESSPSATAAGLARTWGGCVTVAAAGLTASAKFWLGSPGAMAMVDGNAKASIKAQRTTNIQRPLDPPEPMNVLNSNNLTRPGVQSTHCGAVVVHWIDSSHVVPEEVLGAELHLIEEADAASEKSARREGASAARAWFARCLTGTQPPAPRSPRQPLWPAGWVSGPTRTSREPLRWRRFFRAAVDSDSHDVESVARMKIDFELPHHLTGRVRAS